MGRRWTSWCGLLLGLGLALEPARAGDRKSDRTHRSSDAVVVARDFHPADHDIFTREGTTSFEAQRSSSVGKESTEDEDKENAAVNGGHRKALTFFNIKSNVGDIAVQPALGPVKGVQLSLGF